MAIANENVLVFPRSLFEQLGVFQGFSADANRYLQAILDPKNHSFMPRTQAETDPNFKQVIPYVLITDGKSILHYVRGKKAGEQRLVAKGSVGIGGHINDVDYKEPLLAFTKEPLLASTFGNQEFQDAVEREVREELSIQGVFDAKPIGLINDDSTEVGRVHFGVVHVLFCMPDKVKKNEQVITQVEFVPIDELKAKREHMETWSQICLDNLDSILR